MGAGQAGADADRTGRTARAEGLMPRAARVFDYAVAGHRRRGRIGASFAHSAVREHAARVVDAMIYAGSRGSLARVHTPMGSHGDGQMESRLCQPADPNDHMDIRDYPL
jgi:hypothetical protein